MRGSKVLLAFVVAAIVGLIASNANAAVLMGEWKLDGDATDSSGNGKDGVIYSSPTWLTEGGAHFDGVDDYIEIPNTSDWNFASGFTLKASIRFNDDNYDIVFIGKHQSGVGSGYFLGVHNNTIDFLVDAGAPGVPDRVETQETYKDGLWHDVIGIYDGATQYLYVDGQLKAERNIAYTSFNSVNLRIGFYQAGQYAEKFHGDIDEVQVYAGAVPEPSTVPEPTTLIIWSLLGAIGLSVGWWRRRKAA